MFPPPELPPDIFNRIFHIIKYTQYLNIYTLGYEFLSYFLAFICLYHSYKKYGFYKTILFFSGSFLFTGLQENFWILTGLYGIQPTYYFNFYSTLLWFICCPIATCLAWYYLAYATIYIAKKVFPNKSLIFQAFIGGFIAMDIDLLIDPLAERAGFWVWNPSTSTIWILGIPFTNFIAWFLLIFIFAIFWEKITFKNEWSKMKRTLIFFGIMILSDLMIIGILQGCIIITTPIHSLQIPPGGF